MTILVAFHCLCMPSLSSKAINTLSLSLSLFILFFHPPLFVYWLLSLFLELFFRYSSATVVSSPNLTLADVLATRSAIKSNCLLLAVPILLVWLNSMTTEQGSWVEKQQRFLLEQLSAFVVTICAVDLEFFTDGKVSQNQCAFCLVTRSAVVWVSKWNKNDCQKNNRKED